MNSKADDSPATVPDLLARCAAQVPDIPALSTIRGKSLTYGEWHQRARAGAHQLAAECRPGDAVALPFRAAQWPAYGIAYVACQLAGLIPVPCPAGQSTAEWQRLVERCGVGLAVLPDEAPSPPSEVRWVNLARAAEGPTGPPLPAINPLAHLLFTAGTTGAARAVAVTHAELMHGSSLPSAWQGRVLVHTMAPESAAGTEGAMMLALKSGMHAVAAVPSDGALLAQRIADSDTRAVLLTPSAGTALLDGSAGPPPSHVRLVMLMGSAAPAPLLEALAHRFPAGRLVVHYGATEAGSAQLLMPYDPKRPGAVGRALGATEVRVVRDGREVPSGETGEVLLRRRGAPRREYRSDDGSGVFAPDGWVRTGDLGSVDAEGYLTLLGRIKDIVVRGGRNIPTGEVEAALTVHPAVAEAAAFGVPHDTLGEMLVAVVVPAAGQRPPDSAELRRALRERLAAHKVPTRIRLVDRMPRNAAGKVRKDELRRDFLAD